MGMYVALLVQQAGLRFGEIEDHLNSLCFTESLTWLCGRCQGRSRQACEPQVDAVMLAAHLETLSGHNTGDDGALGPPDEDSPPLQIPGLDFALEAASKPDLDADTTGSVEGDQIPLASDAGMTEAAAPTPKLAAAEAADMTVEIPASLFATPFPSRNAGASVDGKPLILEEVNILLRMWAYVHS